MHIIAITSVLLSQGFQLVFQFFVIQSVAIETRLELHGTDSVNVRIVGRGDKSLRCHQETVINTVDQTDTIKVVSGACVTIYGMSGLEGSEPARNDPIDLQLPRAAAGGGNPQTSTTPVTRCSIRKVCCK